MPAFLIITSLSLVFYLALVAFLYRDGRKRRPSGASVYKVQARSAAEIGPLPAMVYAGPSPRRRNAAALVVRFAENPGQGSIKSRARQSEPAEVIPLPTFACDNDDVQCG